MRQIGKIVQVIILVILAFGFQAVQAQTVWSEVQLDANEVFFGEPVEVTISVYTSTWFTKGIDPGNIKVNGAFSIFFRPVSTSIVQNGKTYAGVNLIYHVFPYEDKNLQFPVLNIDVETPPEGGFEGKKKRIKTQAKNIKVKPVPPGFDKSNWLVADGLTVQDQWSSNLQQLKVGDVLTRTIRVNVDGTVSELIPPITWDSISNVSLYPTRSTVDNQKSKTSINAYRQESMRFLLEDTGKIEFPEMVMRWYNPTQKKMYKRTLKAVSVNVMPNPNLGMLASIRDSLQVMSKKEAVENEDQSFTIFGFSIYSLVGLLFALVLALWGTLKIVPLFVNKLRAKKLSYLQSEPYYFKQFAKAIRTKNHKKAINAMYCWVDRLHLSAPTASYFAQKYGNKDLQKVVSNLHNPKKIENWNFKGWKNARQKYLLQESTKINNGNWINP